MIAIILYGLSFCALFVYVLHHPQGNERTGDIRSSWVDVITAAGPILLRLGRATTWRCFGAIFEISSGRRKSRIYPNQNIFSQKYFKQQVDSF